MDGLVSGMGGVSSTPAISFHTIIDEDLSLIKYIILNCSNNPVFDLDKIKSLSYMDLIRSVYLRKYNNPLYLIMSDDKYKDFLDKCYKEFIEQEDDILSCAISTDIANLVYEFGKSSDIVPTIFYYTDKQKDILKTMPECRKAYMKPFSDIVKEKGKYTQFYFKNTSEVYPFEDLKYKTLYFSSCGLNLTENNNDLSMDEDYLKQLIYDNNHISIFDMYAIDIFGKETK